MTNPDGYTALDLVGYTDQGDYDATKSYVANDLVHYDGSIWCCLIDDTVGITPTEGVNWRFWVEDSQKGISDIVNKLGAKNLLKIETKSITGGNVILTVNNDGSLTINGTATPSAAYFTIMNHDFGDYRFATDGRSDANAQYILSGLPTDPYLYMTYDVANKRVALILSSNHTADNVTFYPMIRPKNIEDDTWVPYTKTNKELTAEVTQNTSDITQNTSDIQTLTNNDDAMLNVLGAENLLPNNAIRQVINGVDYIVRDNSTSNYYVRGTVRAVRTSTSSSNAWLTLVDGLVLPRGNYILSGCPSGGGASTYRLVLTRNGDTSVTEIDDGNGCPFTVSDNETLLIRIVCMSTFDGDATFCPMIRPASIEDDTYVPYAMTNRELTLQSIQVESVTATTTGGGFISKLFPTNVIVLNMWTPATDVYCEYFPATGSTIYGKSQWWIKVVNVNTEQAVANTQFTLYIAYVKLD